MEILLIATAEIFARILISNKNLPPHTSSGKRKNHVNLIFVKICDRFLDGLILAEL
jgi:hypothetical protein